MRTSITYFASLVGILLVANASGSDACQGLKILKCKKNVICSWKKNKCTIKSLFPTRKPTQKDYTPTWPTRKPTQKDYAPTSAPTSATSTATIPEVEASCDSLSYAESVGYEKGKKAGYDAGFAAGELSGYERAVKEITGSAMVEKLEKAAYERGLADAICECTGAP